MREYVLQHCESDELGPFAPVHQTAPRTPSPARTTDPATSHAASESVDVFRARALHREIVDILRGEFDGLTDEQIRGRLASGSHSYSGPQTRRNELVAAGWVTDSGRKRKMSSGRQAVVWVLTSAGYQAWKDHRPDA